MKKILFSLALASLPLLADGEGLPAESRQLLVALAPGWNARQGTLQRFERSGAGGAWRPVGAAVPVLFGKNGLAWGSGVAGQYEAGQRKRERDGRTPAGIFAIGKIYTSDARLPAGADYPFVTVTDADVWPDDPANPYYNQHLVFPDPAKRPEWFTKQRMKPHDPVYRWLIEIRHNSDPIVAGAGSATFFHIRRGETRPTSGCTTMAAGNLEEIVRWLRAGAAPHFVVMPRAEYAARASAWGLPPAP